MKKFGEKDVNDMMVEKADEYLGTASKDPKQRLMDEIKKRQLPGENEVPKV